MKSFTLVLMLFFSSNLYASDKPYAIDYALVKNVGPEITHTNSMSTVLLSNNVFEIPARENAVHFGRMELLLTPVSDTEVLVTNIFVVDGKEYSPEMTVVLGEETTYTADNISYAITVSPYVPDVIN